jgi:hypothetical protein
MEMYTGELSFVNCLSLLSAVHLCPAKPLSLVEMFGPFVFFLCGKLPCYLKRA